MRSARRRPRYQRSVYSLVLQVSAQTQFVLYNSAGAAINEADSWAGLQRAYGIPRRPDVKRASVPAGETAVSGK